MNEGSCVNLWKREKYENSVKQCLKEPELCNKLASHSEGLISRVFIPTIADNNALISPVLCAKTKLIRVFLDGVMCWNHHTIEALPLTSKRMLGR